MIAWTIALFVVYWQYMAIYLAGGVVYSLVKWVIQLYRLRTKVLAINLDDRGKSYPGYSDEDYIKVKRDTAVSELFGYGSYPPKASKNKSTLFWWAVFWPINLVWTMVADVAREVWGFLYRQFGAIYDKIATSILPK